MSPEIKGDTWQEGERVPAGDLSLKTYAADQQERMKDQLAACSSGEYLLDDKVKQQIPFRLWQVFRLRPGCVDSVGVEATAYMDTLGVPPFKPGGKRVPAGTTLTKPGEKPTGVPYPARPGAAGGKNEPPRKL